MNRWLASRWLILSALAMAAAFYLALHLDDAQVFGEVAMVALAGGHFTNGMRQSRGHPTDQPPLEEDK